jgi:5'-nucleotidase
MGMIRGLISSPRESFMRKKHLPLLILVISASFMVYFFSGGDAFSQKPYRILITNDDGIRHPGIEALVVKLGPLGEITVAAPSKNQSGVGHGSTFPGPIPVESWERGGVKWFSIEALPATCVRLALLSLLSEKPDIVVAGINKGANVGVITFSSGTVACAREAAYWDVPALSVNLESGKTMEYDAAADFVAALVKELKEKKFPPGTYLNINIPNLPKNLIKGVLVTRQDLRPPDERYEKRTSPEGETGYWSIYKVLENGDAKTDAWALSHDYISISPFQIDQTQYSQIKKMKDWRVVNPRK